jgi:hypothetical protein
MQLTTLRGHEFPTREQLHDAAVAAMKAANLNYGDTATFEKVFAILRRYDCEVWPAVFEVLRRQQSEWFTK